MNYKIIRNDICVVIFDYTFIILVFSERITFLRHLLCAQLRREGGMPLFLNFWKMSTNIEKIPSLQYFHFINKIKLLEALIFQYYHEWNSNVMFTNVCVYKHHIIIYTNFSAKLMRTTHSLASKNPVCSPANNRFVT